MISSKVNMHTESSCNDPQRFSLVLIMTYNSLYYFFTHRLLRAKNKIRSQVWCSIVSFLTSCLIVTPEGYNPTSRDHATKAQVDTF